MKALDHTRITAEAIRQFVRYSQGLVAPMLLQYSSLVQTGSKDTDQSPLYTRATNWHFYKKNLDQDVVRKAVWPYMEPLTFHLSSDHILLRRCEQLRAETAKKSTADACDLTGRILHHIQDMSIPSHVVPIFHGQLVEDSFETYLSKYYLADDGRMSALSGEQPPDPSTLLPGVQTTILHLYEEAAENTLSALKIENSSCECQVNGTVQNLSWNYFWSDQNTHHNGYNPSECKLGGFGSFGPLGMNFGTTEPISTGGNSYQIERSTYDRFCTRQVKDMLENSIKALFILEPDLKKLC
jgi:hypothetical protein